MKESVCTFSTSDSHHSFKPNITSEIPPERKKRKRNFDLNLVALVEGHHVIVM